MKTSPELVCQLIGAEFIDDHEPKTKVIPADSSTVNFIHQIRLEAYKKGVEDSINLCKEGAKVFKSYNNPNTNKMASGCEESARNLTQLLSNPEIV